MVSFREVTCLLLDLLVEGWLVLSLSPILYIQTYAHHIYLLGNSLRIPLAAEVLLSKSLLAESLLADISLLAKTLSKALLSAESLLFPRAYGPVLQVQSTSRPQYTWEYPCPPEPTVYSLLMMYP